ncbi:MAG TPA: DNA-binding domain-containing protein [Steroidobacteraceae bacterium]|nr:DNA-binding domain-containing protein [Steroidobacteraceae bacterium]
MRQLAGVQEDFQDYLLRGSAAVERHVVGSARVPVATRLGVYSGAYRARLAEALQANFPALAKLLDTADFEALASHYVAAHDSAFFSIRYYGHELPQFLSQHPDYTAAPVLAELARWEWTMTSAFDAADATPLEHAALAQFSPQQWPQLRFSWHPSVARLGLSWNVPQLWQALTQDAERPAASVNRVPVQWLLWRQQLTTYFRSLAETEARALDAARDGWPFGELCALLCDELGEEQAPLQAATLLRGWVDAGLITGAA